MSQAVEDTPVVADQQALRDMIDKIGEELHTVLAAYQQHAMNPRTWPNLAAALQSCGESTKRAGETLADRLVDYAEAHPDVEVPADGPAVMMLPESEHREIWNVVGDLYDPQGYEATLAAYAEVLDGEHGRPDLEVRAVALDEYAVMVLQYLPEQGPDAICQVYIGGWDHERHADRIAKALAEHGITPGAPRFWPPLLPDDTFLNFPGETQLYDEFGRRVDRIPSPGEQALRAVAELREYLRNRELLIDDRRLSAGQIGEEITAIVATVALPDST